MGEFTQCELLKHRRSLANCQLGLIRGIFTETHFVGLSVVRNSISDIPLGMSEIQFLIFLWELTEPLIDVTEVAM